MDKTVLITGATGLIGRKLIELLIQKSYKYICISKDIENAKKKLMDYKKMVSYDNIFELKDEKIDFAVNLAGENLGSKRWTEKAKQEFYNSRINTTNQLMNLFSLMAEKPKVLVSASGIDYYGNTGDKLVNENSPNANTFLGKLTSDWEKAALKAEDYGIRTVILRIGLVMAKESDAINKIVKPIKYFIGGPIGLGNQYVSWIHIEDLVHLILFAIESNDLSGIYNAVSPRPVTNAEFIKNAAKILRRPAIMHVPEVMIRASIGEMADLVLSGRKASAEKIINSGFGYRFEDNFSAWKDILN